jgi:hypothetical protein
LSFSVWWIRLITRASKPDAADIAANALECPNWKKMEREEIREKRRRVKKIIERLIY